MVNTKKWIVDSNGIKKYMRVNRSNLIFLCTYLSELSTLCQNIITTFKFFFSSFKSAESPLLLGCLRRVVIHYYSKLKTSCCCSGGRGRRSLGGFDAWSEEEEEEKNSDQETEKIGKEKEGRMFYSQCLLSRKGPLRAIWVAAYCHKKLKKDQVAETDIPSSVDEIVLNEVTITYRVLGYLLLGVVRIYSKKVEYLYHDCKEVMIKINTYSHSRKNKRLDEAMCAPYISITLPDTFELDSFDLEIVEDVSRGTMETHQLITLEETREDAQDEPYFLDKYHHEEGPASFPTTVYSPVEDDTSPRRMDIEMVVSPICSLSGFETSMEKLLANQIPHEEHFDFEMFPEFGEPLDLGSQLDDMHIHEEQIKVLEITPPDAGEPHVLTKGDPVASPNVGSPEESKLPHNSGDVTPEVMIIPTPVRKEQKRSSRKRKQLFDEIIVLSNEVVRLSLHDSSSLVCKRRRAPQTALDAWRACTIPNLRENFLKPLISGFSSLKALFNVKDFKTHEQVEVEGPINSGETHCKYSEHGMPEENSFVDSESAKLVKCGTTVKSDKGPTICTGVDELAIETPDPGLNLIDEEIALNEGEQNPVADEWSIRTRTVATYLCKSFLSKKEKRENEVLNLAPVLEGRTRKESARLFYEVLVLKSRGVIDVKQETPFGDISLLATPQTEGIALN